MQSFEASKSVLHFIEHNERTEMVSLHSFRNLSISVLLKFKSQLPLAEAQSNQKIIKESFWDENISLYVKHMKLNTHQKNIQKDSLPNQHYYQHVLAFQILEDISYQFNNFQRVLAYKFNCTTLLTYPKRFDWAYHMRYKNKKSRICPYKIAMLIFQSKMTRQHANMLYMPVHPVPFQPI
eukprot:TRINITY_DN6606_c0_g1_i3.p1 TRINITY_DN6606_c0_g1~~TRINITY_DN6606_c0_g1_i3.p1  ORF type:complete len:204 (-),score=-13.66 TRINITY_DN6606_c0_g1_i3:296-835(-)